ncbi:TIGR02611 family protein [Nocardioides massiliensis]|uniref:Uncharacterized protein (TIGR02611 family) n=1 Tax=Nocardioides massiliensis TaxID=1325935 RepID=A0ABT9NRJ2_9ACTN|nr:TIGR02611 family protein [Nocardioides massiliensis]MDP9822794.1 uncharacterized protein (TIGR02611 family) [Nocardioides massiliensis]
MSSEDSTSDAAVVARPGDLSPAQHSERAETVEPVEAVERLSRRGRLHARMHANPALALATKIGVTIVGTVVVLAGVVMMVTPGPGMVGIAVGLAILSTEYHWAERWLRAARRKLVEAKEQAEQMDPVVRRRRIMLVGLVLVAVAAAGAWYVWTYDWPRLAVDSWAWLQGIAGWIPDLPGM